MYPEQRARDRRRLAGLVVALLGLIAVAVMWGVPHMEGHLTTVSRAALDDRDFETVQVEFSGRDAQLSGVIPNGVPPAEVVGAVASQWGVRRVEADLGADSEVLDPIDSAETTTTVTTLPAMPSISVSPSVDGVVLEGTVASQVTAAAINATAASAYGRRVEDRLTVDEAVGEPAWAADIATLLRGVGAIGGSLTITDNVLTVSGMAPDEATRASIIADLLGLDDGLTLENHIELDPITSGALFAIDGQPGSVTLRGTVDSEDRRTALLEAGEQIYGSGGVTSALSVDPSTELPRLLEDAAALFQALEGRRLDLIVHADGVYLRGIVPSDEVSDSIAAAVGDLAAPASLINELTVVAADPDTIAAVGAINDLIGTSVTFESGSPQLTSEAEALLDQVAAILVERPELRGVVEGHTDNVGAEADNLSLSEARARSVVRYLIEAGVADGRLTSIGFGESRPIESNATEAGRAANRRIEFKVEGSI